MKNPYFRFYPGDFYLDTATWSDTECGAFIRCLSFQWEKGFIPNDIDRLARIAHSMSEPLVRETVLSKFDKAPGNPGQLVNAKLESVRVALVSYKEKLSAAGKKGAEKKWGGHDDPNGDPNGLANGKSKSKPKTTEQKAKSKISKETWEAFWSVYPRKVGKKKAGEVLNRINPDAKLLQIIITAVKVQCKSEQWTKDAGQFIPHPATWLNQERWEDATKVQVEKPAAANPTPQQNSYYCETCNTGFSAKNKLCPTCGQEGI
jgi:uncharacterized protein YdaU (DUF1376 family)